MTIRPVAKSAAITDQVAKAMEGEIARVTMTAAAVLNAVLVFLIVSLLAHVTVTFSVIGHEAIAGRHPNQGQGGAIDAEVLLNNPILPQ